MLFFQTIRAGEMPIERCSCRSTPELPSTICRFAISPEGDGNDVKRYRRQLKEFTGFDQNRVVRDLSTKEIEILLDAIQRIEGYKVGKEIELGPPKPILDVKRDKKNQPVGYLVEDRGWLSPTETVKGILDGEIDGVVAHRAGKTYVKTRPDGSLPNNIDVKGRDQ